MTALAKMRSRTLLGEVMLRFAQFGQSFRTSCVNSTGHGSLVVKSFEEKGVEKLRISSILHLVSGVTVDRTFLQEDPGAVEETMTNQFEGVSRAVFGSTWAKMVCRIPWGMPTASE